MALSASVVWEIRHAGSNNNGGGYKTGASGTDRTKQDAAFASLTTLSVVNATTTKITISLTDYTVVASDIGNVYHNTGGTSTAGFYEITGADTVANTWTLDRSIGTAAQTCTGAMGGGLADPGYCCGIAQLVAGQIAYLLDDALYSITSATVNIAGGVLSPAVALTLVGYHTTRTLTTTDSRPTIQLNVSTATMFTNNATILVKNVIADGNTQTAAKLTNGQQFERCKFINFNTASSGNNTFRFCEATTNSAAIFLGGNCVGCEAYANTGTPFSLGLLTAVDCLSYANTGASTDGFTCTNSATFVNCTSYNNGRDGFRAAGNSNSAIVYANCHAESNSVSGAFGFNNQGGVVNTYNCSTYLNNGATSGINAAIGAITLSASAFTNAAGNDFSLNNTAGGGASLRAAGYQGLFPRGTTTSKLDVGAVQHADPVSTSGGFFIQ